MKRLLFIFGLLLTPAAHAGEIVPEPMPEPLSADMPAVAPDSATAAPAVDSVPPPESLGSPGSPGSPEPSAAAPAGLAVLPGREGYAFKQPEILVRQRLFGLAHGVSLLAAACLDLPEQSVAIQNAYAAWHERHVQAIATVVHDLADYYFGPQTAAAQWLDLVRALKLKESIDETLGQFSLSVACASLPQAMTGPRYDLTALLQADPAAAMATIAGEPAAAGEAAMPPVPPAPPAPLAPAGEGRSYESFPRR